MAWTLTNTASSVSVSFSPKAGETKRNHPKPTAVLTTLSGKTIVHYGPTAKAALETPDWIVEGAAALSTMESILGSGARLQLTDDRGTSYYCRVVDGWTSFLVDGPDRVTNPRWRVTVKLQEVE